MSALASKVFLSYVTEDERHLKALATHLKPLEQQGVIQSWSAQALEAGELASAAIEAHRGEAAIVLVLVSPDYLAHEGGEDGELAAVLRRRKAEGIQVIPVLVRPCAIEETALGALSALPENRRPISKWTDKDEAWVGVARALRALLADRTGTAERATALAPVLPRVPCFLGRDALASQVVAAVTAEPPSSLVLLGGPGIGKTTLSVAVLHRPEVRKRFGARRLFVRLEGATSADTALSAVATAIGLAPATDLHAAVRAWLAEAPALLVLDNLETPHHADRAGTEALLAALAEAPDVALLASVRGADPPEGVAWKALEVKPLAPPHDTDLFCELAPTHSDDRTAVSELVAPLGGVPLALALLAYAARGNDLANLRREWQDSRTATLARGGTDRHASWAACVDVSFRSPRMTPEADRLARVLALLPAGAATDDLPALLAGAPAAARTLAQVGLAYFDAGRLRMLPPLRDHVSAARADDAEDRARAAQHYRAMAATLGPRAGRAGGREAIERLSAEWANVESMVQWGLATGQPEPWIEAAAALCNFVRTSGFGGADVMRTALRVAERDGNTAAAAQCAEVLGHIALARSDHGEARTRFEAALPLYRQVGSMRGEANCIRSLGNIALRRSDHDEARTRFEAALALFRQVGSMRGEANCIRSLGDIALLRSDHGEARTRFEAALALFRQVGSTRGEANCIQSLGNIALERSEHGEARTRYEAALPLYRHVRHVLGEANCIKSIGDIALRRSDHGEARTRYEAALPLYRQVGSVLGEAYCILRLGDIALAERRAEEAGAHYERALTLYARIPEPYSMGLTHRRLAGLARTDADRARHVNAARQLWTQIDRPDLVEDLQREIEQR